MKERPILFSAPMVRALLDGTKTQTRRVVKGSERWPTDAVRAVFLERAGTALAVRADRGTYGPEIRGPYGQCGDRLWVRETWSTHTCYDDVAPNDLTTSSIHYWADGEIETGKGRPSIHMPRRFSRIDLEVTGVRIERLQDISEQDAMDEGFYSAVRESPRGIGQDVVGWYRGLWEQINGAGSWNANPWVWVVSLRRARP